MTRTSTPHEPAAADRAKAVARSATATALSLASRMATRLADSAASRASSRATEQGVASRIAHGMTTVASIASSVSDRLARPDPQPSLDLVPFARGSQPELDPQGLGRSASASAPASTPASTSASTDHPPIEQAATPPVTASPPRPSAVVERVSWVDYGFVGLAIVSLCLLIAEQVVPVYVQDAGEILYWLVVADVAICGLFAIEFFARMRGQPSKWAYAKSRWYDVLGMIPVSHPMFRGFRLIRIVRIAVVTSRLVRATNRSFGDMLVESTVRRFRDTLVNVIGGAIVVRGVDMVQPWLVRARFAERIGDAMELRRDEIRRMVQDSMRELPGGRVLVAPPMRGLIERAETAAVQAVIEVLRSDELNRVVQQSTENVLAELRASIANERPAGPAGAGSLTTRT